MVSAVKFESQSIRLSRLHGVTRSSPEGSGEAILLASGRPPGQLVPPLLLQLGKSVSIQGQMRYESSQHWCSMVFHGVPLSIAKPWIARCMIFQDETDGLGKC